MTTGPESPQPPYDPNQQPGYQPGQQPPGYGQPGQPPPPIGYPTSQPPMRPEDEKLWAIGAHLGGIVLGFIAPLVVWLVFKDRSAFLERTGKEALNMQISYLIYFAVAGVTLIVLIGLLLLPLVGLAWLVLMILATIKVANLEEFRYPAIIRFVR